MLPWFVDRNQHLPKPSVNVFFTSLAIEKTEDAIGVILSGTGSDDTVGIREIKANGGFTFAQEPYTAKYTGMPQSAIDSGCVDWIQSPEKIAQEITNTVRNRTSIREHSQLTQPQSIATQLNKLLLSVKHKTRIDFGGHKEGTIWRRIERRMAANHFTNFDDYIKFTEETPDELEHLSKDILISFTAFFRDPEAFDRLKKTLTTAYDAQRPAPWTFASIAKPTIAAVNGAAVGVGVEFTSQCDIRIAAESARFGWVFVHRGLVPDTGAGTWLLSRIVELQTAAYLLYSGEVISAARAKELNYVLEVVPDAQLMDRAMAMAHTVSKGAPLAIGEVKKLLYRNLTKDAQEHLKDHTVALNKMLASEDFKEGVASFLQKRDPNWRAR